MSIAGLYMSVYVVNVRIFHSSCFGLEGFVEVVVNTSL